MPPRAAPRGFLARAPATAAAAVAGLALSTAVPAAAVFRDVTFRIPAGTETSAGVSWADYDGDGDLDIFVTTYGNVAGNESNRLYVNDGAVGFRKAEIPALELRPWLCTGAAWGDYDDDGDPDLFVSAEAAAGNTLFRNDGADVFTDVTAGALRARDFVYSCVWVDYDRDGDLDLSVASRDGGKLYRNDGAESFADITPPLLQTRGWCIEWRDWDLDGDPDAFVGTIQAPQSPLILARNDGDDRFTDVAQGSLGGGVDGAFSGDFADYDDDGDLDLYVTYFVDPARLFRNDGADRFVDATPLVLEGSGSGAAYTAMWVDYDNDGDPDVLRCELAGATSLYRNIDGSFLDVSADLGKTAGNTVWGASWGDWDGDGLRDLYLGKAGTGSDALLRNEERSQNRWLRVDLEGTLSNRGGVGARVEVATAQGTIVEEVSGGGDGWCSQEPAHAWFGLGFESVATVTVRWPSGQRSLVNGVKANRRIVVREPGLVPTRGEYPAGNRLDFDLVLSGAAVTSAELHLRPAASGAAFTSIPMIRLGGQLLRAVVPDSLASVQGIEYFVEYRLNHGTLRRTPFEGASAPLFLPAAFRDLAAPEELPADRFVLFGFPFELTEPAESLSLADQLGPYDPLVWRMGVWDPQESRYLEPPDSPVLATGQAFWLISRRPVAPAASGRTSNPRDGVALEVRPGWNQVAHPFPFPVDLVDVDFSAAPNVGRRIVQFRGGGYVDGSRLEPWRGFWMYNGSLSSQTIVVPGSPAGAAQPAPPAESFAPEWSVTVRAEQRSLWDRGNEAGVFAGAEEVSGEEDFREPPAVPGAVRAWFETQDEHHQVSQLTRDYRPDGGVGHVWDLVVRVPDGDAARVTFDGVASVPGGWDVMLVPEETFAFVDLRARSALDLPAGAEHRFRLVAGVPAYVADVRAGVVRPPPDVSLGLAWPNPFVRGTRVAFALPRAGHASLSVYDVQGRLVRTLVSDRLPAGRHEAVWRGRNGGGGSASAGVYFLRLRTEDRTLSRKIVLRR